MKIRPLHDRIFIRQADAAEITLGGIIIPGTAQEKPTEGEVIAVGPGYVSQEDGTVTPTDVKVGDKVLYNKYAGTEVVVDDVKYVIVRETDVLAIVDG